MLSDPKSKHIELSTKEQAKREQILDKAIAFFSKNGIGDTKIDDIIQFIGIGKGTFYRYFNNKKDLLLHCIARLTVNVVPVEVLDDILTEKDYRTRFRKRFIAFLKAFPNFSGILSLANQGVQSNDPDLAMQARKTYHAFAIPLIKDLLDAKKEGLIRDIDAEIVAYSILGMGESMGNLLRINPNHSPEGLAEAGLDFTIRAIGISERDICKESVCAAYWDICDGNHQNKKLKNISFNNETYLTGKADKWELQIPVEHINFIDVRKNRDKVFSVRVELKNGQSRILIVDGNSFLSGETEFGRCRIQLKDIASICFLPSGENT